MTESPRIPIISHRGLCRASSRGRRSGENTLAAFRAGIDALTALHLPPALEFDVRRASDHIPVVIHDATLTRVFAIRGRVHRLTAAALAEYGVPTLAAVLDAFPAAECHIELKERGLAPAVLAAIRHTHSAGRVIVSSFLWKELAPFRPHVRIALTTAFPARRAITAAVAAGAWAIHPEHRKTTARFVATAHAADLRVNTWTVNTPRAYARMIRLGVDAVFSDNPRLLIGA